MRKIAAFLLLASAAAPAFAAPDRSDDRQARREAARAERAERAEARQERSERPQRAEQVEDRQLRAAGRDEGDRTARLEQRREAQDERVVDRRAERDQRLDSVRPTLEQRRQAAGTLREQRRDERFIRRDVRHTPPIVSNVPREGTQPPLVASSRRSGSHNWNGSWRNDRRYDWRNWRNRNRSLFNLGFYYDPFGWGYRPYSIGWRLWPSYFGSNYWLNDPWMYRLPQAYPGTRWIRYYDDAVLVDTWTGEVVDVIYSFFW